MLPRTGLANRLLVWGRAVVYARRYGLPIYTQGWGHVHIGPLLRREKSIRYYGRFFTCPRSIRGAIRLKRNKVFQSQKVFVEPEFNQPPPENAKCVIFKEVPSKNDYFRDLRGHEDFISSEFFGSVRERWKRRLSPKTDPFIALHVRRGDFGITGIQLSPESYFTTTLSRLRAKTGIEKAVVFSDARPAELVELSAISQVSFAEHGSEILDLLEMSRADIIVTSLRSTFGYWGGFVSNASIILDPEHDFGAIRAGNGRWFEGNIDQFESYVEKST
ncbi:alpha-1,2-fucosyltransferase [Rubripirellula obstinata]|uniref:alpha-1,2-fucosyltransferase n=1 Tax=Rubripirellula obstinata TaxID=406547 RepID=UPI001390488A|nr:alpha-1,2-fucosyltransferase [Rubripirellula obstinata]